MVSCCSQTNGAGLCSRRSGSDDDQILRLAASCTFRYPINPLWPLCVKVRGFTDIRTSLHPFICGENPRSWSQSDHPWVTLRSQEWLMGLTRHLASLPGKRERERSECVSVVRPLWPRVILIQKVCLHKLQNNEEAEGRGTWRLVPCSLTRCFCEALGPEWWLHTAPTTQDDFQVFQIWIRYLVIALRRRQDGRTRSVSFVLLRLNNRPPAKQKAEAVEHRLSLKAASTLRHFILKSIATLSHTQLQSECLLGVNWKHSLVSTGGRADIWKQWRTVSFLSGPSDDSAPRSMQSVVIQCGFSLWSQEDRGSPHFLPSC